MKTEDTIPNSNPQGPSFWGRYHQVICFFTAIIICCAGYGYTVYLQNQSLKEGQQKIISTFEKHFIKDGNTKYNFVPFPSNNKLKLEQEERELAYEEIKSMLDLEFNKIQNEFEALEIWTGIITVIFLIFSFYSLFKTEQLEQQGKTALKLINDTQTKGDDLLKALEKEKVDKIAAIDNEFKEWTRSKGASVRRLLDKKSQEYQSQLAEEYKNEYDNKLKEVTAEINKKASEAISKTESASGNELQGFLDSWNEKLEQLKADFLKWQKDLVASEADIDKIFEDEPEEEEGENTEDSAVGDDLSADEKLDEPTDDNQ